MGKPSVLLVTRSKKVCRTFEDNLRSIFGSQLDIFTHYEELEFDPSVLSQVKLLLLSNPNLLDSLPPVPEETAVMVARRTIHMTKLVPLMDLPAGTRCLFVTNALATAEDSVEVLKRLGFNHLVFTPFEPKMTLTEEQLEQIDLGITLGFPEYVPAGIKQIIDLNNRPLDLSTIFDIAQLFNLSVDKGHFYTADFFRDFVQLGRDLSISVANEKQLKQQLEAILNAVHEGIIGVDEQGTITFFNDDAGKLLRLSAEKCLGRHYRDVIPDFQLEEIFQTRSEISDQLIPFGSLFLLVTKNPIMLDGHFLGVVVTFQDVTKVQQMEQEIRKKSVQLGLTTKYSFANIIGVSDAIVSAKQAAIKLSREDFTVLITGENGTGKEVFAQAIHENSSRREGPFVPVNFAGLTESLAESELFGYEEGSFTGARKGGKIGLFELAHNGTIFLDEIGDAPLSIQAALLRVLQERQVMRVGGNRVIPVNVRVIAATNRNLMEMIESGSFREDLYYRLNVLPLQIPSLRDRQDDLFILIDYFLRSKQRRLHFSPEVREALLRYTWPGNIRELENFINYLLVISDGEQVEMQHLPDRFHRPSEAKPRPRVEQAIPSAAQEVEDTLFLLERHGSLNEYEDILENLWLCAKRQERVGRSTLSKMLTWPLSDAQIRNRLAILNRSGCIDVGVKKQGTQITSLGVQVLHAIKEERT
ncbi:sigma-54 interaction domain-containing protein [Brevibacillus fulvus]|uniref:PAS domain S-box-containing protein n=1 Tax=Brevibacillus fulvus TaxID=1125967 RepID=A0A938Y1S3_9BACL|nr:sigma 54-interacting transcriptional regulator [Brevibacillus fulvus]MBM7591746.1 PAS domain S-box-containing protein [Brevibacillus fulvus]